jgi:hypothetical protein
MLIWNEKYYTSFSWSVAGVLCKHLKHTIDVEENMLTCLANLFSPVLLQLLAVIVIPVFNFLDILQHVGITNKNILNLAQNVRDFG